MPMLAEHVGAVGSRAPGTPDARRAARRAGRRRPTARCSPRRRSSRAAGRARRRRAAARTRTSGSSPYAPQRKEGRCERSPRSHSRVGQRMERSAYFRAFSNGTMTSPVFRLSGNRITCLPGWRNCSRFLSTMPRNCACSARGLALAVRREADRPDDGLHLVLAQVLGQHLVVEALGGGDRLLEHLADGIVERRQVEAERIDLGLDRRAARSLAKNSLMPAKSMLCSGTQLL